MSDRTESYKYTNKMPNPPTRDASRFKQQVNNEEIEELKKMNEEMKRQNELLKEEVARLNETFHKVLQAQAEPKNDKKK